MQHFMFCFSGYSGVGKDECATHLVRSRNAVHTGLADPAKRHMADLYGFTKEQLFGPSHFRNAGDSRYPKNVLRDLGYKYHDGSIPESLNGELRSGKRYVVVETRNLQGVGPVPGKPGWPAVPWQPLTLGKARYFIEDDHPNFFLSPREALQLYCNLMNDLYLDTWIRKGIEVHQKLAAFIAPNGPRFDYRMARTYDRMFGVIERNGLDARWGTPIITCFSDFRHRHEVNLARRMASTYIPVVVRVKHPNVTTPPYEHRSETEQATIPDSAFDFVIMNDGSLEDLYAKVDQAVQCATKEGWQSKCLMGDV